MSLFKISVYGLDSLAYIAFVFDYGCGLTKETIKDRIISTTHQRYCFVGIVLLTQNCSGLCGIGICFISIRICVDSAEL
jgi:hypothetical protein